MKQVSRKRNYKDAPRFYGDLPGLTAHLRRIMMNRGMTRKHLSGLSGVSSATVSYIFNGNVHTPSLETIKRIVDVVCPGEFESLRERFPVKPEVDDEQELLITLRRNNHLLEQVLVELRAIRSDIQEASVNPL